MLVVLPSPPSLEIQLFGRFAVRVDGIAVDERSWSRRSAQALVKLLALASPHTLHREQLIEVLWPGLALHAGINNLNKSIHAARRALEPGLARGSLSSFILTPGNQIVLSSPGALLVDMHRFEAAAHLALGCTAVRCSSTTCTSHGPVCGAT
jgi:DNA-binding SARP family transcriptional activator